MCHEIHLPTMNYNFMWVKANVNQIHNCPLRQMFPMLEDIKRLFMADVKETGHWKKII